MGETTIEWTSTVLPDGSAVPGFTFNPVIGCAQVSEGCKNCYAEAESKRRGWAEWGVHGTRHVTSETYWKQPIKWNRQAMQTGIRRKVFCASLSDVFERHPAWVAPRARLAELVWITPWLDWLLLSKRPENMVEMGLEMWPRGWPKNVWAGATVENQQRAEERIPHLLAVPAAIRFLSVEPLLEAVRLKFTDAEDWMAPEGFGEGYIDHAHIHWVICGGESGPGARPFRLEWARSIVAQCKAAGVPVLMKQLGARPHGDWGADNVPPVVLVTDLTRGGVTAVEDARRKNGQWQLRDRKGGDIDEWPSDLRIRQYPGDV